MGLTFTWEKYFPFDFWRVFLLIWKTWVTGEYFLLKWGSWETGRYPVLSYTAKKDHWGRAGEVIEDHKYHNVHVGIISQILVIARSIYIVSILIFISLPPPQMPQFSFQSKHWPRKRVQQSWIENLVTRYPHSNLWNFRASVPFLIQQFGIYTRIAIKIESSDLEIHVVCTSIRWVGFMKVLKSCDTMSFLILWNTEKYKFRIVVSSDRWEKGRKKFRWWIDGVVGKRVRGSDLHSFCTVMKSIKNSTFSSWGLPM